MSRNYLNLRSVLSDADAVGILLEFAEGDWARKNVLGDESSKSERSPCIKVKKWWKRHRNLYPFQAIWLLIFGPVPDGYTVSHQCVCKKKHPHSNDRVSSCVNIHHMKLELIPVNSGRNTHQRDLKKYQESNQSRVQLRGAIFLDSISGRQRCTHSSNDDPCFINCRLIKTVRGLFWFDPPAALLRDIRRPVAFTIPF